MKLFTVTCTTAAILLAVIATASNGFGQTQYTIVDLGPVGAAPGAPYDIANNGVAAGGAAFADGTEHAVLWYGGQRIEISRHGLGGPNSIAFGVNERGRVVGAAQSSDPDAEDFCGFNAYGLPASNTKCLPFTWRYGRMKPLPTLGGPNGMANRINDRGEAVGLAETNMHERNCPVSQFEPIIWKNGKPQALPPYPGDTDGVAAWINNKGQVVGASGTCGSFNPNSQLYLVENHALLWENGHAIDLGNLGGTGGLAGNHACAINDRGQIVGHSELANNTTFHGFLWTKQERMQDLGTLPGDYASLAVGINNDGKVVGASLDASFNPRAYVWEDGVGMTDLNTLISGSPELYLLAAFDINDRGEIAGFGVNNDGELHGFLAIPCDGDSDAEDADAGGSTGMPRPVLSETARQLLQQQLGQRNHIGLWR